MSLKAYFPWGLQVRQSLELSASFPTTAREGQGSRESDQLFGGEGGGENEIPNFMTGVSHHRRLDASWGLHYHTFEGGGGRLFLRSGWAWLGVWWAKQAPPSRFPRTELKREKRRGSSVFFSEQLPCRLCPFLFIFFLASEKLLHLLFFFSAGDLHKYNENRSTRLFSTSDETSGMQGPVHPTKH